jgi:isochorismate hydrolase
MRGSPVRRAGEVVVHKTARDAFYGTELADMLEPHGATRLIVTGCATDSCVDNWVWENLTRVRVQVLPASRVIGQMSAPR